MPNSEHYHQRGTSAWHIPCDWHDHHHAARPSQTAAKAKLDTP